MAGQAIRALNTVAMVLQFRDRFDFCSSILLGWKRFAINSGIMLQDAAGVATARAVRKVDEAAVIRAVQRGDPKPALGSGVKQQAQYFVIIFPGE